MDCLGPNVKTQSSPVKKVWKIFAIAILCILLLLVRAYEEMLFYDPLLEYFKIDYKTMPLPEMDFLLLQGNIFLRYMLNSALSLMIVWVVFRDREITKLSLILYAALFVMLFSAFNIIIYTSDSSSDQFVLFYVRRFLIQPLFLLILLPAFYFQKTKIK